MVFFLILSLQDKNICKPLKSENRGTIKYKKNASCILSAIATNEVLPLTEFITLNICM